MESLLRQSRGVCPFLHKTSPATLRSLSTSTSRSLVQRSSRSSLSNLQVLANRCPIMSKALAVQSARVRVNSLLSGAFGGSRAYHSRVSRACLHTTKPKAVEHAPLRKEDVSYSSPAPPLGSLARFDYDAFYQNELDKKHKDKSYRYFNNINRLARDFPRAHMATPEEKVTVWCSNDYLGMGRNPQVLKKMHTSTAVLAHMDVKAV